MMSAKWRPAPGYEGYYEVSDYGAVRGGAKGGILRPFDNGRGYLIVTLFRDGKKKHERIHRLVAAAFIPMQTGKDQVNHRDLDKKNNHVSNLEWVTGPENVAHFHEARPEFLLISRSFTDEQAAEIRRLAAAGQSITSLAEEYGAGRSTIGGLVAGRTYTDVSVPMLDSTKSKVPA